MVNEFRLGIFLGIIVGVVGFIVINIVFSNSPADAYKNGQIDALTGKIRYELVTMPDSTRRWIEKDNMGDPQ